MAKTIGYKLVGRREKMFAAVSEYCKKRRATEVIDFAMETTIAKFDLVVKPQYTKIYVDAMVKNQRGMDGFLTAMKMMYPNSEVCFGQPPFVLKRAGVSKNSASPWAIVRLEDGTVSAEDSDIVSIFVEAVFNAAATKGRTFDLDLDDDLS